MVNISTGTMVISHYSTFHNEGNALHNGLRRGRHAPCGNRYPHLTARHILRRRYHIIIRLSNNFACRKTNFTSCTFTTHEFTNYFSEKQTK
jgi:hypothetical protein